MAVPSKPTNLKVNISLKEAKLTWSATGSDITDYEVRHAEGASVPDTTAGVSTGSTSQRHTVTRLKIGAEYAFQVRAVNADGESEWSDTVTDWQHRRGQIIDAFTDIFSPLKDSPDVSGYPIQVKAIRKRYVSWTQLSNQNALPALLITASDGGSAPDAPSVGYIDERFPIGLWAVLEETDDKNLIDQYSDAHYSIGSLINANRRLVSGVEDVRIRDWRTSEESYLPHLLVKFRVYVIHRYHAKENV